ncbi:MAG: radical SAM protein [Deltaproteobacteria bacterium]|nr:radical SAM protein [Deltaproteobacteria bacterium]
MVKKLEFEQGPIRPPSEARSFLLRITRNCPWNQCLFCPVYKNEKFSLRTVDEIKQDILIARNISDDIKSLSWKLGFSGEITPLVINHIFNNPGFSDSYRSIAIWHYFGTGACFIQDADNLVMETADIVEVLKFLREKFPDITRVTTYSRSRTIVRKSVEELRSIKDAGLDRVHVGLESGYDPVLKFMKKGVTAAQHIEAGRKILDAGMELSEYIMPGLGGLSMWKEHAVETAKVLNQINPDFIRLRSLRLPDEAPLKEKVVSGEFIMLTDDMVVEEIKLFIKSLDGITSTITSDHIMNLLEDVTGKMPEDRQKMIDVIEKYQAMPDHERLVYRVGRRGGYYHSIDDINRDPAMRRKIENMISDLGDKEGENGIEEYMNKLVNQYL